MKRAVVFILAIMQLASGCLIYLLFRSTSLLMFRWVEYLGASEWVNSIRSQYAYIEGNIPNFVIYSLPFALWTSSSMMFYYAIWWKTKSRSYYLWFWCVPFTAIGSELLQIHKNIPGTYDSDDLLALCIAVVLVVLLVKVFPLAEILKGRLDNAR